VNMVFNFENNFEMKVIIKFEIPFCFLEFSKTFQM